MYYYKFKADKFLRHILTNDTLFIENSGASFFINDLLKLNNLEREITIKTDKVINNDNYFKNSNTYFELLCIALSNCDNDIFNFLEKEFGISTDERLFNYFKEQGGKFNVFIPISIFIKSEKIFPKMKFLKFDKGYNNGFYNEKYYHEIKKEVLYNSFCDYFVLTGNTVFKLTMQHDINLNDFIFESNETDYKKFMVKNEFK